MAKHETEAYFKQIGGSIAAIRKDMGLSQEQLAEILNLSQSALAHYETGIRRIPLPMLTMIAHALGVHIDDLIPDDTVKRRGPMPQLEREFAKVRLLPERQQQMVIEMIQSIIKHNSSMG